MTSNPSMVKRLLLIGLTLVVVIHVGLLLFGSLGEPQITSRLELYQTDLVLNATELQPEAIGLTENTRKAILGENPLQAALEQYQSARESATKNLVQLGDRLSSTTTSNPLTDSGSTTASGETDPELKVLVQQQQALINQLDLRIGILQAQLNDPTTALQTWVDLQNQVQEQPSAPSLVATADTLISLWSDSPRILPDAEQQLQKSLEGWFRYTALRRLYELQQRSDVLIPLQEAEQQVAEQTLVKLSIVGSAPILGSLFGTGLLIFLIAQRFIGNKQSLLQHNANLRWDTPWNWDVILQVLIVGFFFLGQFVVPLILQGGQGILSALLEQSGVTIAVVSNRAKAIYSMTYYLIMAGAGLLVLYLSVRPFQPLPEHWFRFARRWNWFLWGIGGYLVALPLMILVSLLNQQLWQGQGGSNPLLQIILEEADPIALAIFFVTAAIAAPIFEETLFRGFLLPSLTRYVSVWQAIILSGLVFAIAHLSLSEVIPLTLLGTILGVVYTRSRSLLAPILLHSLWNSATMISLFILGSGAK